MFICIYIYIYIYNLNLKSMLSGQIRGILKTVLLLPNGRNQQMI